jgi:hypothetical protein
MRLNSVQVGQLIWWRMLASATITKNTAKGGPKVLSSMMKVGSHLPDEEFDKTIIPCIIRMFATPDRAIRMSLLEVLPSYVNRLSKKVVNEQIFPHVVSASSFSTGDIAYRF